MQEERTGAKPASGLMLKLRREPQSTVVPVSLSGAPSSPPLPSPFFWDVFDMLLMSVGSCVFFHLAERLGGPGPISGVILRRGLEPLSHCPSFPSCLSSGPSLQCRMGDNLLIAKSQCPQDDNADAFCVLACVCQ